MDTLLAPSHVRSHKAWIKGVTKTIQSGRFGLEYISICSTSVIANGGNLSINVIIGRSLHYPFYTNLAFACKTETLDSLHSQALLILAESSKYENQVVHMDLESDIMRGLGSIHTGCNILSLDFFVFMQWRRNCITGIFV